jgi:asparagine synthase (glutamine-hydrolysing)
MASDYMGVRPLHYYAQRDFVSWSTTIECLVHFHELYDRLEPRFLVGFLTSTRLANVTPYTGVLSVPTAHSVTFSRSGAVDVKQFWRLGSPEIRYRDDADYEVHLRTLFFNGVRNRLRSLAPVWAQLSGGLDSSAVVCAADALVKQGLAITSDLQTVSFVTDGTPETDERRFIACVDRQRGRVSHYIRYDDALDRIDYERNWITPNQPPNPLLKAYDLVRRSGGRMLLTGDGGDSVMGNVLDYHFDVACLLQHAKPLAAVVLARERALAAKLSIWDVLHSAALELLPSGVVARRMLSRLFASNGGNPPPTNRHVEESFLLKSSMAREWRDSWRSQFARTLVFPDLSQRQAAIEVILMAERRHAQSPSDEPLALTSHPFLDRPLVEFMLGVPIGVVAPPGQARGLMRRAFAPFMPPRIIARFSKGCAAPYRIRDSRDILLRWVNRPNNLRLLQLDVLDPNRLVRYLETLRDKGKQSQLFVHLVELEQWLESREHVIERRCVKRNVKYG